MQTFRSSRLLMRPLAPGDRALYIRLYTDPDVMRHIGPPLAIDSASEAFVRACELSRRRRPDYWLWTVVSGDSPHAVGLVGLRTKSERLTEIGTMLVPEAYGRGYATEIIARVTLHALADLGFDSVEASHREENRAVGALLLKLGFQPRVQPAGSSLERQWKIDRDEHKRDRLENRWAQWIGP